MIITEFYLVRGDGVRLVRSYSDSGMMIRSDATGALYSEAIDPEETGRTYTETDEPIPSIDDPDDLANAARILMGVEE